MARARHTPSFLVFMTSGGLFTVRSFLHAAVLPLFLPLSVWMEISLSLRSHRPMSRLLAPSLPVALFTGLSRLKIPAISSAYFCSAVVHRAERQENRQRGEGQLLGRFNPDQNSPVLHGLVIPRRPVGFCCSRRRQVARMLLWSLDRKGSQ